MVGSRRTGYSLIEIALAMGILVVVLLSAMSFLGTSMTLQRTSAEIDQAMSALERRAAAFRALLHSAPMDSKINRETQFTTVLETLSGASPYTVDAAGVTPAKTYDLDLIPNGPSLSVADGGSGTEQARISVWGYTQEQAAQAPREDWDDPGPPVPAPFGGCGLTDMDLNADATFGDTANFAPADLHLLPLKLQIVWVPATADPRGADVTTRTKTLTLVTVLY